MALGHQPGPSAWTISLEHQPGPSAWTISLDHQPGPSAWTISLDHQPGPSAWTISLTKVGHPPGFDPCLTLGFFPACLFIMSALRYLLDSELDSVQYVLYTAAISINLILGLPTNVYVVWLIVTGAVGTMASDFFSLNLAVSEILYSLSNLMFIFHYHIQENGALWRVGAFFAGFNLFGRPLFQCCICVERYLAVVHPVTFLKYKPLRYRVGCCGVVWLMVLGFCFVNMFGEYQYLWWECFDLILNMLTLSVMLFCCLAVLWALKRSGPGEGEREGEGMNNMKLRAFRIISVIMVSMIVSYLPLVLILVSLGNCPVSGDPEAEVPLGKDIKFNDSF
ncbi:P2Y purinoceptor 3-like [Oncorhynchus masou masou]|uniref:P2Y purinoceptor 3-like n=1 Tax=Oncorhynchus masou masou TaxID=90313 RepID=UPI003183CECA